MSPDVVFVNIQVRNILKSSDRFVEIANVSSLAFANKLNLRWQNRRPVAAFIYHFCEISKTECQS